MPYIVRHQPNQVDINEEDVTYHGPFESFKDAERYCTELDWKREGEVISFPIELVAPVGTPEEWPVHMTQEEFDESERSK